MLQENIVRFAEPLKLCRGGFIATIFVRVCPQGELVRRPINFPGQGKTSSDEPYLFVGAFDDFERGVLNRQRER